MGLLELLGGALVAVIGALFFGRSWGARSERQKQHEKDMQNVQDTHDRIDAVPPVDPDDRADIFERLRKLEGKS